MAQGGGSEARGRQKHHRDGCSLRGGAAGRRAPGQRVARGGVRAGPWARTLLRQARDQLGAAYSQAGKGAIFNALEDQLVDGDSALPYREIGATLGLSEASARFAAFRLRQQFRQILHGIVADTVASPDEIEAELAQLRKIFQD